MLQGLVATRTLTTSGSCSETGNHIKPSSCRPPASKHDHLLESAAAPSPNKTEPLGISTGTLQSSYPWNPPRVLVSEDCHNKSSQTQWLKITLIYYSSGVLTTDSLDKNQGTGRAAILFGGPKGESVSLPTLALQAVHILQLLTSWHLQGQQWLVENFQHHITWTLTLLLLPLLKTPVIILVHLDNLFILSVTDQQP